MKKASKTPRTKLSDDMRPEYDFSKGVRGKYAARFAEGTNVVVLDPDVADMFPTSTSVNDALRALAKIIRSTRAGGRRRRKSA
jgi:hypothetical protein